MSFLTSQGKIKSTLLINSLFASFLLIAIFAAIYWLLLEPVTGWFEQIILMPVWGPPILLSLISTLLCQLCILTPISKLLVPSAFAFLAVYAVMLLAAILAQIESGGRDLAIHLWAIYTIPPVLIGNGISWTFWAVSRHKQRAARQG